MQFYNTNANSGAELRSAVRVRNSLPFILKGEAVPHAKASAAGAERLQVNKNGVVVDGGQDFLQKVGHGQADAAGIAAGMTGQTGGLQHGPVNNQLDTVLRVVHQTKHGNAARVQVEKGFHMSLVGKGGAGDAKLIGQYAGLQIFVSRQHDQIETGLLPIAQKQILAHGSVQEGFDFADSLHGEDRLMINTNERHLQTIQQIIDANFGRVASIAVQWPSGAAMHDGSFRVDFLSEAVRNEKSLKE